MSEGRPHGIDEGTIYNFQHSHLPEFLQPQSNMERVAWSYEMRRDMQEVFPGLYLGPLASVQNNKVSVF